MYNIEFIKSSEIETIIPFLQLLDTSLKEDELEFRLQKMIENNYLCIGVFNNKKLIGISGLWIIQKYYTGKYIEPDNVVIHPDYRGKGIGEMMSKWIDEYAIKIGCVASNLNVYSTNSNAIRFWLNQGYRIISFHLQKKFDK